MMFLYFARSLVFPVCSYQQYPMHRNISDNQNKNHDQLDPINLKLEHFFANTFGIFYAHCRIVQWSAVQYIKYSTGLCINQSTMQCSASVQCCEVQYIIKNSTCSAMYYINQSKLQNSAVECCSITTLLSTAYAVQPRTQTPAGQGAPSKAPGYEVACGAMYYINQNTLKNSGVLCSTLNTVHQAFALTRVGCNAVHQYSAQCIKYSTCNAM